VKFLIRDAVPADMAVLADVFRRSSLSNEGDRVNLLANPDALEFPGTAADGRRTRVAAAADGRIAGFTIDHDVMTRFGPAPRMHLDVVS
jgi:hypothetical protein